MKIFLSAIESADFKIGEYRTTLIEEMIKKRIPVQWNLMSYYYLRGTKERIANLVRDYSELTLIDSGAHSFQFGKKVDWVEYTKEYANFIKRFDRPSVVGYFEMDIENIISYDKVLELRKILESASNKIIPVWHPPRGIEDYEKMCQKYSGKVIAIGGFRGTDIKDSQFINFLKTAKKYDCKVHCLGMTRIDVLDKVPFDYTDSASWKDYARFGRIGWGQFYRGKVTKEYSKTHRGVVFLENYKCGIEMQKYYYAKWRKECKD